MPPLNIPPHYRIHPEIRRSLQIGQPVVALESAVITHGLPRPDNLDLARQLEEEVRQNGALPATIAVLNGEILIGMDENQLLALDAAEKVRKISRRDFSAAVARGESGGTTVAATLIAAHTAGIRVFATGGIGGVHRQAPFDVSADLIELGRTPMVVICAGAKAILDLPSTLEVLETHGVTVVGYQTDEFPAFYSVESGLPVTVRADSPEEIAAIAEAQVQLGLQGAILVTNPPPLNSALPGSAVEDAIQQAVREASQLGIRGQAVTPFLLNRVTELTGGTSKQANIALLRSNARLAGQIARALVKPNRQFI